MCRAHVHQPTPCPPLSPMCNRLDGQRVEPLKETIGASRAGGGPASAAGVRQFTCAWQATGRAHARACNRQLSYGRGTRIRNTIFRPLLDFRLGLRDLSFLESPAKQCACTCRICIRPRAWSSIPCSSARARDRTSKHERTRGCRKYLARRGRRAE